MLRDVRDLQLGGDGLAVHRPQPVAEREALSAAALEIHVRGGTVLDAEALADGIRPAGGGRDGDRHGGRRRPAPRPSWPAARPARAATREDDECRSVHRIFLSPRSLNAAARPRRVAAIAGRARIGVAGDVAVVRVGLRLVRMRVAVDALEGREVPGVLVAVAARRPATPVRAGVDREVAPVVVEVGPAPGARVVAVLARRREARRRVVRVGRAVVVRLMARVAVGRRAGVAAADVAGRAGDPRVRAGQREARLAVVEAGRLPGGRVVAGRAGRREAGGRVVRVAWCPRSSPDGRRSSPSASRRSVRRRGSWRRRSACARRSAGSPSCCGRSSPAASHPCCGSSGTASGSGWPRGSGWSCPRSRPVAGVAVPRRARVAAAGMAARAARSGRGRRSAGSRSCCDRTWRDARPGWCGSSRTSSGSPTATWFGLLAAA